MPRVCRSGHEAASARTQPARCRAVRTHWRSRSRGLAGPARREGLIGGYAGTRCRGVGRAYRRHPWRRHSRLRRCRRPSPGWVCRCARDAHAEIADREADLRPCLVEAASDPMPRPLRPWDTALSPSFSIAMWSGLASLITAEGTTPGRRPRCRQGSRPPLGVLGDAGHRQNPPGRCTHMRRSTLQVPGVVLPERHPFPRGAC